MVLETLYPLSWVIVFLPSVIGDKPLLNLEVERAE